MTRSEELMLRETRERELEIVERLTGGQSSHVVIVWDDPPASPVAARRSVSEVWRAFGFVYPGGQAARVSDQTPNDRSES